MRRFIKLAFVLIVALFACREAMAETSTHIALHGEEVSYLGGEVDFPERILMSIGIGDGTERGIKVQDHSIVFTTEDEWDDFWGPGLAYICMPNWVESFDINVDYCSENVKGSCKFSDVEGHLSLDVEGHLSKTFSSTLAGGGSFMRTTIDPVTTKGRMKIKRNFGSQRRSFKLWCTDNVFGDVIGSEWQDLEAMCNTFAQPYVVTQEGQGFKLDYERSQGQVDWDVVGMHTGEGDDIDDFGVLTIPSSVKSIADQAFVNCEFPATKVVLPGGNFTVGSCAFSGCSSLQSIEIVDSGKMCFDIGDYAFDGCTGLTSVYFPACVNKVGKGAFAHCSNLREFTVDDANSMSLSVKNGLLCDKLGLTLLACPPTFTSVTIPSSITSIQYGAFMGCDNLTEVITAEGDEDRIAELMLEAGFDVAHQVRFNGKRYDVDFCVVVFDLGNHARRLGGGELVQFIKREGSAVEPIVTAEGVLGVVGGWSQSLDCIKGNAEIAIRWEEASDIPEIIDGVYAVVKDGCVWTVTVEDDEVWIGDRNAWSVTEAAISPKPQGALEIPDEFFGLPVVGFGYLAFLDCDLLTELVLPDSVEAFDADVVSGCSSLTAITVGREHSAFSSSNGMLLDRAGETLLVCPGGIADVVVPEGVRFFGGTDELFGYRRSPFPYPGSITKSIRFPASMERITYDDGSVGSSGLADCSLLTDIFVDSGNAVYKAANGLLLSADGTCVLSCAGGVTDAVVPQGVKNIGHGAFFMCGNLTSVAIPDGVTCIGESAFDGCTCLTSVTIPDSISSIGDAAFADCTRLLSVCYNGNAPEVEEVDPSYWFGWGGIYMGSENVTTYVREGTSGWGDIPGEWQGRPIEWWTTYPDVPVDETVEDGVYVVSKDGYDWTVTVEYGEVWIGDRNAWSVSEAAISPKPHGALEIPDEFFDLPVVGLTMAAFMGCEELTEVSLPQTMYSVSGYAFWGTSLQTINVDEENPYLRMQDGFLVDDWQTAILAVGKTGACAIPNGVASVPMGAFLCCPAITYLSLPGSVEVFDAAAVDDCAALVSITVAEDNPNFKSVDGLLLDADGTALAVCPGGIADVVVPNGVTAIGVEDNYSGYLLSPFPSGSKMRSITIPASVERIADGAFSACESLTEITVDSGNAVCTAANGLLMTADGKTLLDCAGGCIDVVIPDGVTEIGGSVFSGSFTLRSVTAPSSVRHIGAGAFSSCYYLTSVCLAGDAPEVDDYDDWGWTLGLYEGSEYATTFVQSGTQGWGEVPGVWHERPIKYWTVDNPSPIPELEDDVDFNQILMALYGSKDDKLVDNILMTCLTEGDSAGADLYNNYRLWAGRVQDENGDPVGLQVVRNSPTAWTSFALDQTTLLERDLTDGDLKIEEFKPSSEAGTFDFTVSIKDVAVGPLAMAENLKKTFGLEGATELVPLAFDEANVGIEFGLPEKGKLKFTAEPLERDAKSFFMKMSVK